MDSKKADSFIRTITMKTPKFYVYKCIVDNGGAPCVQDELLSLAICKPMLRRTAEVGNWLVAFGSKGDRPSHRLIYIAEVTKVLDQGEYYTGNTYFNRKDCIYRKRADGQYEWVKNLIHGPEAMDRDLGKSPHYASARTIISDNFRYFGRNASNEWIHRHPHLAVLVSDLKQGHRNEHADVVLAELMTLRQEIWRACPGVMTLGQPTSEVPGLAERDDDCVAVCEKAIECISESCDAG